MAGKTVNVRIKRFWPCPSRLTHTKMAAIAIGKINKYEATKAADVRLK